MSCSAVECSEVTVQCNKIQCILQCLLQCTVYSTVFITVYSIYYSVYKGVYHTVHCTVYIVVCKYSVYRNTGQYSTVNWIELQWISFLSSEVK